MGIVLKFPLEQVSRTSSVPAGTQAEILVFEGVRYEPETGYIKARRTVEAMAPS